MINYAGTIVIIPSVYADIIWKSTSLCTHIFSGK